MKKEPSLRTARNLALTVIALLIAGAQAGQKRQAPRPDGEWPAYGRDAGGSRYSELSQINRQNIKDLKIAWTYNTGAAGVQGRSARNAAFEATPIFVDDMLYLSTPFGRVIALNPVTGTEAWSYDPKVDLARGYSEMTSRGVS